MFTFYIDNGYDFIVRPKGEKPMTLLTTLDAVRTRKARWQVVQGYVTRWRIEALHQAVVQARARAVT